MISISWLSQVAVKDTYLALDGIKVDTIMLNAIYASKVDVSLFFLNLNIQGFCAIIIV